MTKNFNIKNVSLSFACMLSHFSHVRLLAALWIVAHQAPLSMGFSRQECWSGCHALLQGIFPTQGSNQHLLCLLHWQWAIYTWEASLPFAQHKEQHSLIINKTVP